MDDSADPNPLSPNLTEISDGELLAGTRRLVGASNQVLAALLTHLGEIEARGIYRTRACSSLYIYCVYELRFSEDAAFRRVSAARLVRKFPALLDVIASGELHLTALLMVGPQLTAENFCDVLARAKHRTKREIARLVRELDPLPDVPARIEPLGPVVKGVGRVSHEKTMLALYPVRHLPPGERPRDWIEPELAAELAGVGVASTEQSDEPAPARNDASPITGPQRFMVQFTATPEHVELVERAQALLAGAPGGASLAAVHLRALRELVSRLEKQKYGAKPSKLEEPDSHPASTRDQVPRQRGATPRHRYIAAPTRREVFEREAGRCSYVDAGGQRCRETHCLEMHHLQAFGLGGEHEAVNLTLRCRAHNALAAEEDFGRAFVEQKRTTRHESFSRAAADAKNDLG